MGRGARQSGVGRGKKKEWKKGGKTRSSYNKTPRRVSQVETAICVRKRVAGNKRDREGKKKRDTEEPGRSASRERENGQGEGRGGRVSVGYTYVCRPRVQCIQIARKRVVTFRGKVI